ncbi:hypothetical protein D9X91_17885 [Falsibacillus albus]|uniref:Uncharacterized protein n=1 Tax=Falsibacillus albus TaxID=2478915 RepID=A0A3L7JRA0_9BACI|nr:hypothetical protein D9X91_17885 [Falsibacillus albus]
MKEGNQKGGLMPDNGQKGEGRESKKWFDARSIPFRPKIGRYRKVVSQSKEKNRNHLGGFSRKVTFICTDL